MNKNSPKKSGLDSCMLTVGLLATLVLPVLLIGFGTQLLRQNYLALSWPVVPIAIAGSEAYSTYTEDSETREKSYSVDVKLFFSGNYDGQPISGLFIRSADAGKTEPSASFIEEKRQEILKYYQRDGLVAHVNPADLTDTMVEPSLTGPIVMLIIGILLLIIFLFGLRRILTNQQLKA